MPASAERDPLTLFSQLVEVQLQAELVEVDQRDFAKRFDEVELDEELLGLGRLRFPDGFF